MSENQAVAFQADEVQHFVDREVRVVANRAVKKAQELVNEQSASRFATKKPIEQLIADGLQNTTTFQVGSNVVGVRFPGNDEAIEHVAAEISDAMQVAAQDMQGLERWEIKRESPDYLTMTWENPDNSDS